MERLTFEGNFCDISRCEGEYRMTSECADGPCSQRKVWERLKAYEETGLMPEEITGLKLRIESLEMSLRVACDGLAKFTKAEEDGRLVVLPCKVGDTVYFRTWESNATVDLGIQPHEVAAIRAYAIVKGKYTDVGLSTGQYGVTWFNSREEAEAALGKDNNVLATDINVGRKEEGEADG